MLHNVVLLRHALAGVRQEWVGDDQARPLDRTGVSQVLGLSEGMRDWPIDEIWTSPAVRCRHTVMALAAERRLPVRDAAWLSVDAEHDAVVAALAGLSGSVLLCVHGESVDGLLGILTGDSPEVWARAAGINEPLTDSDFDRGLEKGAAWHLRFAGETLVEATLMPAPTVALELAR